MRRVNQRYVIATSTRLDISKVKLADNLDDSYFRRDKKEAQKQRKQQAGDIFAQKKASYQLSDTRKKDQVNQKINLPLILHLFTTSWTYHNMHYVYSYFQLTVDKQILSVVKANPDKKLLFKYLGSPFYLRTGQFPHRMKFWVVFYSFINKWTPLFETVSAEYF